MAQPTSPPFQDWGRTEYRAALARQLAQLEARRAGVVPDALIFTEHEPVFTLGARRGAEQHVLWDAAARAAHGIAVVEPSRGGDVTYHGPGQLVGYAIVSLDPRRDLHAYLRVLEQTLINALGRLGLASARRPGQTGVWLGRRKIAAIGVAVRSWVAWHGFALNVDGDLGPFAGIVPCGLGPDVGEVTSLARELGAERLPSPEEIKRVIAEEFWELFAEYRAAKKVPREKKLVEKEKRTSPPKQRKSRKAKKARKTTRA
jgi:lipoyl(octanoyl) transferase